jgi:hypothetical protein
MGLVRRVACVSLLLLISQVSRGQGQLLLLDRSGSMKPYYQSGLIAELGKTLNSVMQSQKPNSISIGAFNDHVELVPGIGDISVSGPTYLDVAVDYAMNHGYSVVWLITDNIMHRSGEEEGRTTVFYERLKREAVERVVIFPLKQEPGKGHAGIMVYALLLSSSANDVFKAETAEFARLTPSTVLLPMKPLDRDTIETIFTEPPASAMKPTYTDGSVIQEQMEVRFRSKFDHLRIVDADITNPRVAPEFSQNSLLNFEKDQVTINPTKITELGPRGETIQRYTVSVDLGKIRLKRDPVSLWRAALRNPNEEISLDLAFSIKVPKEKFQFTEEFLDKYSASTTEKAKAEGKIYELNDLPLLVAENRTSIDVPHKPKVHVSYPWWLVFVFPGLPALAGVIIITGGVFGWRAATKAMRKKSAWTVDVSEPTGANGIVQRGHVTVVVGKATNRLGRIQGASFITATGVAPKGAHAVKDGGTVKLVFRRTNYTLRFRSTEDREQDQRRKERKTDGTRSRPKI